MKKALIFGITGQDGSYLSELLLSKGYEVVGVIRRSSTSSTERIDHIWDQIHTVEGDITDSVSVYKLIAEHQPEEIYNPAAQSHVKTSFEQPLYTWQANAEGVVNILEAIRHHSPDSKFYQASTSEMFGKSYTEKTGKKFQNEDTSFIPQSPYAIAKCAAHHSVRLYRKSYDLFSCSGILFNHESERRGGLFVTRKITKYVAKRYNNPALDEMLRLGNLKARRDWGHAEDYVRGMWLMLQQDEPDDYVLATGETHSVSDLLDYAFSYVDTNWKECVVIDPEFYRPAEVDYLLGDASKARQKLGWEPEVNFQDLVSRMVEYDINEDFCETFKKQTGLQRPFI